MKTTQKLLTTGIHNLAIFLPIGWCIVKHINVEGPQSAVEVEHHQPDPFLMSHFGYLFDKVRS